MYEKKGDAYSEKNITPILGIEYKLFVKKINIHTINFFLVWSLYHNIILENNAPCMNC